MKYTVRCIELYSPPLQDTVSKLLSSSFKEEKTKRELHKYSPDMSDFPPKLSCVFSATLTPSNSRCVTVSGDAALLVAEMLKIFVQGKKFHWAQFYTG